MKRKKVFESFSDHFKKYYIEVTTDFVNTVFISVFDGDRHCGSFEYVKTDFEDNIILSFYLKTLFYMEDDELVSFIENVIKTGKFFNNTILKNS